MSWIIFAILGPFLFTLNNFLEKYLVEKKIKDPVAIIIFGEVIALTIGVLAISIKGFPSLDLFNVIILLTSGALLTYYQIPYFKALAIDDASRVVPLFQLVPIFTLVMSFVFLKESLTAFQLIGFAILLLGGFVLGNDKLEGATFKPRPAFWLMVVSSFLYSITGVLFKLGTANQDFWTTYFYQTIGLGLGALVFLFKSAVRDSVKQELTTLTKSSLTIIFINQLIFIGALLSLAYAYTLAPVSFFGKCNRRSPTYIFNSNWIYSY